MQNRRLLFETFGQPAYVIARPSWCRSDSRDGIHVPWGSTEPWPVYRDSSRSV